MNTSSGAMEFRIRSPGPGAYQVRLVGHEVSNTVSVLLSGKDDVAVVELEPGTYTAIIEPVGSIQVMRQTIELSEAAAEPVRLRDEAYATGSDDIAEDYGSYSVTSSSAALQFRRPTAAISRARSSEARSETMPTESGATSQAAPEATPDARAFSLGVSVRLRNDPSHRWRRGSLPVTVSDEPGGGAAVVFRRPLQWERRPEWRLTAAVAGDRRWRMRIPLFRGGVQVLLMPTTTVAGLDLAVSLTPRRPERAALVANLESMFLGSAKEIIQSSFPASLKRGRPFTFFLEEDYDPWTCTAAALLLVQADEVGEQCEDLRAAAGRCAFIPDMTVLLAWAEARQGSEAAALDCLRSIPGHPYFAASQSLGLDLLTGLALGGATAELRASAKRERDRWAGVRRRQLQTGAFLSWEDSRPADTHSLDQSDYETIATGHVTLGNVSLIAMKPIPPAGKNQMPALKRHSIDPEDTWLGRFGGLSEQGGFRLDATFSRGPAGWVEVAMTVRIISPGVTAKHVELFMHETFHPDRVELEFIDGVASHTVLAWGGFTVGAWIPKHQVELELNLAEVPGAPAAIRNN